MLIQTKSWQLIFDSLVAGIPVMLLLVVESKGSSPGRAGFMMAVSKSGPTSGTIGGGIMEHKLTEWTKELLDNNSLQPFFKNQIHHKEALADRSGMICSGEQVILFYPVKKTDIDSVQRILDCLLNYQFGQITVTLEGIQFTNTINIENSFSSIHSLDWKFVGGIGYQHHIHIAGAGHCASALCHALASFPFYVHVYDDREDLAVSALIPAHEKKYIKHYNLLKNILPDKKCNYVVVMTEGYRTDKEVILALSGKQFSYLGVLGSQHKIDKLWEELVEEGISKKWLRGIHAPIGLPIFSKTPEEIAISIIAQIIQHKNSSK